MERRLHSAFDRLHSEPNEIHQEIIEHIRKYETKQPIFEKASGCELKWVSELGHCKHLVSLNSEENVSIKFGPK